MMYVIIAMKHKHKFFPKMTVEMTVVKDNIYISTVCCL